MAKKKRPCLEWPNCECPKCESYRLSLDHIFTWDRCPGMGFQEAKDRPLQPVKIQPRMPQGMDRPKSKKAGGARAWMVRMRAMRCHYCGEPGGTIDHVVPVSQGGRTTEDNCVPACSPCNNFRGDRPYGFFKKIGWMQRRFA